MNKPLQTNLYPQTILMLGYGILGHATYQHIQDTIDVNQILPDGRSRWNFNFCDIRRPKDVLSVNYVDVEHLEDEPSMWMFYDIVIICLPSHEVSQFLSFNARNLQHKTVIVRSTLPLDFAQFAGNFSYVPEYAVEHSLSDKKCQLGPVYFSANAASTKAIHELFPETKTNARSVPFKTVAAHKLLRNAASAANAAFHNSALKLMRDHQIDPRDLDTRLFLQYAPKVDSESLKKTKPTHSLSFEGKCLKDTLNMLTFLNPTWKRNTPDLWHSLKTSNETLRNSYIEDLVAFIKKTQASKKEGSQYNLVVHGLSYHGGRLNSTFKHSLALEILYGLTFRAGLKLFTHPKAMSTHLNELRQDSRLNSVKQFSCLETGKSVHGMVVLQPMTTSQLALKYVVPMVPKNSSKKPEPFHLFDPLCQITDEQVRAVQKLTKTPIEVIRNFAY